jgi:hypothetical protein
MQSSADSNKNASSFDNKPSSTFQLVVASVDWKSKAISNLGYNQHESSCASLLSACAKCLNSHESSCASRLAARAQCLKSHEASCIFHLVARAKCHNKSNVFAFRLIVEFIQTFQSQMQQDFVDLSLSNAFSIAKLDSISIKAKSNSAILIDLPTSQQKTKIHFYDGSSQNKSSCASLLAACAKSQSEVQRHVKFIVELVSEGERNAPTVFQTFSSTVAFTSGAQSARASPLSSFCQSNKCHDKEFTKETSAWSTYQFALPSFIFRTTPADCCFHCRKLIES